MSKYSKGSNFERDLVKHFAKLNYLAVRAFDDPVGDDDRPLLIQCKTSGAISQFERKQLKQAAEKYGIEFSSFCPIFYYLMISDVVGCL